MSEAELHPLVAAVMDALGWKDSRGDDSYAGFGNPDPPIHRTHAEQAVSHAIPQAHLSPGGREAIEAIDLHVEAERCGLHRHE